MSDTFQPGDLSPVQDSTVVVGTYRSANTVALLRPTVGQVLTIGAVYTVAWSTSAKATYLYFSIELSTNGGADWVMLADEVHHADRAHEWEVAGPASSSCMLRITGYRIASSAVAASGVFTIAA